MQAKYKRFFATTKLQKKFATTFTICLLLAIPVYAEATDDNHNNSTHHGDNHQSSAMVEHGSETGQSITPKTVIATVNGTDILLAHMIALYESLPPEYHKLTDEALYQGVLNQLIQQTLLEQSIKALSLAEQVRIDNNYRNYLARIAINKIRENAVDDAALQAAYDANFKGVSSEVEYEASHILVETQQEADDISKQLEDGANFADLAKQYSIDNGSGAQGGSLGWFGKGVMVKAFEAAVISAAPGQIVGPVETQFGWHLILVTGTRFTKIPTFDAIRFELSQELERNALQLEIDALTAQADVTETDIAINPGIIREKSLLESAH